MRTAKWLLLVLLLATGCSVLPIRIPEPFLLLPIAQEAVVTTIYTAPYSMPLANGNGFFVGDKNCFLMTYHQHKSIQRGTFRIYPNENAKPEFLYAKVEFDLAIYRANNLKEPVRPLMLARELYHPGPGEELLVLSRLGPAQVVRTLKDTDKTVVLFPGAALKEAIPEFENIIFTAYLVFGEVRRGQSGSPLLNKRGEVIGMMHIADTQHNWPRPSFAIPLSQRLLKDIFKLINC